MKILQNFVAFSEYMSCNHSCFLDFFRVKITTTNLWNTKRAKSPGALLPISHETEKLDLSLQRNISTLEDSMVSFSMHCIRGRSLNMFNLLLTT